jgi:anti-sigma B factor antagonist
VADPGDRPPLTGWAIWTYVRNDALCSFAKRACGECRHGCRTGNRTGNVDLSDAASSTGLVVRDERVSPVTWLIAVEGQVDLYTAPELKSVTLRAIDAGAKYLVVDLSETSFMDSTGLGVLVGALKRLQPRDGSVSVVCPDESLRRLFEIAGLTDRFAIYETPAAAAVEARTRFP